MAEVHAKPRFTEDVLTSFTQSNQHGSSRDSETSQGIDSKTTYPVSMLTNVNASRVASHGQRLLQVSNLEKVFGSRDAMTHALSGISFTVDSGEFIGIMGPSGSGKTTLLNCIATIDKPSAGSIRIDGKEVASLSKRRLAAFRRESLGFVFQESNLLDTLTGYENIALALTIKGAKPSTIKARIEGISDTLNIREVLKKYPYQMSGGQRQRVAAARAIVGDPKLILADEPTGALDSRSASILLDTLTLLNSQLGATILMVTHDGFAASFASRIIFIKDGRLFNEIHRGHKSQDAFYTEILEVMAFLGGDSKHMGSHAFASVEDGMDHVH